MSDGAWPVLSMTGKLYKGWNITAKTKFKSRKTGKIYKAKDILFADIDTIGPQFWGFITKKSYEKTNCIDDWDEVETIKKET